jgi:hypothetical protein
MGKMKTQQLSDLESDPVLQEQYWLEQMTHHHFEPVPPLIQLLELSNEKDLSICQFDQHPLSLYRRETTQLR